MIKATGVEEEGKKQSDKVCGMTWAAAKAGNVYVGHMPFPMATLSYQIAGNKLVAITSVMDMVELLVEEGEADATTITPSLAPQMMKERSGRMDFSLQFNVKWCLFCFLFSVCHRLLSLSTGSVKQ